MLKQTLQLNDFQSYTEVIAKAVSDRDEEKLKLVIPRGRAMNASVVAVITPEDDLATAHRP